MVLDKMAAILVVLDKMAAILFKMEHHWRTECHWKTKCHWNSNHIRYSSPHCVGDPWDASIIQLFVIHISTVSKLWNLFVCEGWYHLPCGIEHGSFQDEESKESFCHRHRPPPASGNFYNFFRLWDKVLGWNGTRLNSGQLVCYSKNGL